MVRSLFTTFTRGTVGEGENVVGLGGLERTSLAQNPTAVPSFGCRRLTSSRQLGEVSPGGDSWGEHGNMASRPVLVWTCPNAQTPRYELQPFIQHTAGPVY